MRAAEQETLFDVPDHWWRRRRCQICGCALSVHYTHTYAVQRQGWVKIGGTNDPKRRINELRRPAWSKHIIHPSGMDWQQPLTTLAVIEGDIEHRLHEFFEFDHAFGEWFHATPSLLHVVGILSQKAA